jgi:tetratricopeptide (TPR) repeat protein
MSSRSRPRHSKPGGPRKLDSTTTIRAGRLGGKLPLILGLACLIAAGWWCWVKFWNNSNRTSGNLPPIVQNGATQGLSSAALPAVQRHAERDDAFKTLVNRGNALLEEGKPEQALQLLSEALQMNPADEDVHYDLGLTFARLGKLENARQHYEEALRLYPQYVEAHNNLGNLLMRQGRSAEAIEHFETAIKIMPDYASAHNNLGTALQRSGLTNEALLHFEQAAKINPDYWEAHFNVATSCLAAGKLSEAGGELKTVLRLKPDFQPAKEILAEVQSRAGADAR